MNNEKNSGFWMSPEFVRQPGEDLFAGVELEFLWGPEVSQPQGERACPTELGKGSSPIVRFTVAQASKEGVATIRIL